MLNEEENNRIIDILADELFSKANSSERPDCSEYCDHCDYLKFRLDPDPYDTFEADDQKAVCLLVKGVISVSLRPCECHNIFKPLFCPRLGRELSKEEEKEAAKRLAWAREGWEKKG